MKPLDFSPNAQQIPIRISPSVSDQIEKARTCILSVDVAVGSGTHLTERDKTQLELLIKQAEILLMEADL